MVFIRGAITVENNDEQEILKATEELLKEVMELNHIGISDIASIVFTATKDLDQAYPAVAARHLGIVHAALMCVQEMYVVGSLPKCIRIMVQCHSRKEQNEVQHVYLRKAQKLRPDIVNG